MAGSRVIKAGNAGDALTSNPWAAIPNRGPAPSAAAPRQAAPVHSQAHSPMHVQEDVLKAAYQRGREEGEAAVRKALEQGVHAKIAELAGSAASLAEMRFSVVRSAQSDLLQLSLAIARRILHREALLSPNVLEGIISVVLEKLGGQEVHRLRVHPSVATQVTQQIATAPSGRTIQVVPDPTLKAGGCVFETARGNIDAGIESQLSEIERGLADHLEGIR